ncbi:hypothetical protein CXG81DRAFT_18702 [Caulochytrium protostelioides]|uniref:DNA polymerase epsilon subunit D n=1 Tax=Caulochytrium protostelioides TaxID=1555241 RepID=A0A4P9X8C0_9FUNG|nr:hypothetical protein CXG81DRAFT_18702 [Caulochytrium protostelioides]|eukprot:RKP01534.1 hypothetical protein CXG81DRAFT_18702 [Caulochytrium protostelioides]
MSTIPPAGFDEYELPYSITTRIIRDALSRAAVVFINYLAASAIETKKGTGKRTLTLPDVLAGLEEIGLAEFKDAVQVQVGAFNQKLRAKKKDATRRKLVKGPTSAVPADADADGDADADVDDDAEADGAEAADETAKDETDELAQDMEDDEEAS